jgi:hypothetical protein
MILGLSVATFTQVHVIISLLGILAGAVVVFAMLRSSAVAGWTAVFLIATVATSATGFLFHSKAFGPPHVVGVISLVVLAVAIIALYVQRLAGAWRWIYVISALLAFYLNVFVAVVQSFQKIPPLHELAPNGSEPPFAIAQLLVLALFIALTVFALKRFHPARAAGS